MTTTIASKTVPLLDLSAQHREIRDEILAEITRVIDSQKFILGDDVKQLEQAIAPYCGAKYAIGCASGSDALFLALLALDLQPGDEVLTTPYTFFATVGAICRAGAVPVFLDIEPETFNMDMRQLADRPRLPSQNSGHHPDSPVRRLRRYGSSVRTRRRPRHRGDRGCGAIDRFRIQGTARRQYRRHGLLQLFSPARTWADMATAAC